MLSSNHPSLTLPTLSAKKGGGNAGAGEPQSLEWDEPNKDFSDWALRVIREFARARVPPSRLSAMSSDELEQVVTTWHREILDKEREAYNLRRRTNAFKPLIASKIEQRIRDYTTHKARKLFGS